MATRSRPKSTATRARSVGARPSDPTPNRWPLIAGAAAVVILAVLIAVFTAQDSGTRVRMADIEGDPEVTGQPLDAFDRDAATDPAVGRTAPRVDGADFDGADVTIGGSGTSQLIGFMSAECPFCQEELPRIVTWQDGGGVPDGVELTVVVTGLQPGGQNWPPDAWVEDEGYDGRVLVDDADGSVASAYGLTGTPYWVALDANGDVVQRVSGAVGIEGMQSLAAQVTPQG
jgi:hypothetical protein